jgi:hypothetical protein
MTIFAVIVIVGALVGAGMWIWASASARRHDRAAGPPGPVDVTDRDVTPPAPGTRAARAVDVPGSRRNRAAHGKP